jgi:hypothetical protein
MEPGSIVEFFEEKLILCGVVLELKGERLRVLALWAFLYVGSIFE